MSRPAGSQQTTPATVPAGPDGEPDVPGSADVRPPIYRDRQILTVLVVGVVAALVVPLLTGGDAYSAGVANLVLIHVIAAVGFYFAFAVGGQFAFSQAAFVGIGAYTSAWAVDAFGGFWIGPTLAIVVTALLAAAFAAFVVGARHFYFAIATLGFAEISLIVIRGWRSFAGIAGERSGIARPSIFGQPLTTESALFFLLLGCTVVALLLGALIERSPLRRDAIAARDLPAISETLGLPVNRIGLVMFTVGSAYAGFAGALFAHRSGFITTGTFEIGLAIDIFLMVILGGMGSMWGAVIGAVFVIWLPEFLRPVAEYRPLVFALLLLITIIGLPEGITGLASRVREGVSRRA